MIEKLVNSWYADPTVFLTALDEAWAAVERVERVEMEATTIKLPPEEAAAVRQVIALGGRFGYGNLIAHLKQQWALMLMRDYHLPQETALRGTEADPYPLDWKFSG